MHFVPEIERANVRGKVELGAGVQNSSANVTYKKLFVTWFPVYLHSRHSLMFSDGSDDDNRQ